MTHTNAIPDATTIPERFRPDADGLGLAPFHALLQHLRHPETGCPWDRSRTLPDMGKPLLDEAAEAAEALASDDHRHQCEELGDVLLNVMLATVIAEEEGKFTWREVVEGVTAKLIRRHPHVFGGATAADPEEAMRLFQAAKAAERDKT
ncbi:MAG: nucleotide pyrophosphohydrolase [Planctomycetes bacterium]|nr:nucleotide pyrophosphohydrolase [Planctomycetota bacterium]